LRKTWLNSPSPSRDLMDVEKTTMATASLKRPSVCSVRMIPRGTLAGSATDSTATGSGGATMAPSAKARGTSMPGTRRRTTPAAETVVTAVRTKAMMSRVRQRRRNTDQEARLAIAKSRGGRKSGRMISGSIANRGSTGRKDRPATASSRRMG
jgi:hypothetical protein